MNLKKLNILLVLFITLLGINNIFYASETESQVDERFVPESTLQKSIEKAVEDTNFNGSIMISKNKGDEYNVLYEGAAGTDGGYDIDTIYDVGSVSKLYTTTAIMMLEEQGKLNYNDKITKYFDNVPKSKQNVTIKMLLTHTSGIYAEENDNHNVTKANEIKRILNSEQKFEPDSNYLYSNAGFTLLAAIIEEASGQTYEEFMFENIFDPLGLTHTGFPNTNALKDEPAVVGTLNGVTYGKVTNFDFGWYSKGYSDVLTTPRELTYFFQALISGKLIGSDNLALMDLDEVDLGGDTYRGYGTDVKHKGTNKEVVGHTGIWYGGNTAVYYRPADHVLFVLTCDSLVVSSDLPANYVFNTLNAMYPAKGLNKQNTVETVEIEPLIDPSSNEIPKFETDVSEIENEELISTLSKQETKTGLKSEAKTIYIYFKDNPTMFLIALCILLIVLIILVLFFRLKDK